MKKTCSLAHCALALAILMMAFSCKKDAISKKLPSPKTSAVSAQTDSNFVSLDMAVAAAKQAPNSHITSSILKGETVDATTGEQLKEVLDYTAYPNSTNPSLYIINYKGGGFVVIPADKRVEPVLAFSDKGYFPVSAQLPDGVSNWLNVGDKNMQLLRKNTTLHSPTMVKNLWTELKVPVLNNSGKTIDVAQPPPPPCEPTYSSQQVGPLLQTAWAQGIPYNQNANIPLGNYFYGSGRDPVGCVATAMAQVMYYWKYPASYNWSIMPLTSTAGTYTAAGETEISRLMYNVGSSVHMTYAPGGSSPASSWADLVPNYTAVGLEGSFGYSSATGSSYNNSTSYFTVLSNLNSNYPVILAGATSTEGHEWVCDGYWDLTSTWCPSNGNPGGGESVLYFDMNWGWNEAQVPGYNPVPNVDGWFDFNYWSVLNINIQEVYSNQLYFTYNIHP
jgi:hypothetical protein